VEITCVWALGQMTTAGLKASPKAEVLAKATRGEKEFAGLH
jgi:hypothetical protein